MAFLESSVYTEQKPCIIEIIETMSGWYRLDIPATSVAADDPKELLAQRANPPISNSAEGRFKPRQRSVESAVVHLDAKAR